MLDASQGVCFPSILEGSMEGQDRLCHDSDCNSSMANSIMVSSIASHVNKNPSSIAPKVRSTVECTRGISSFVIKPQSSTSGLDSFRDRIKAAVFSEKAIRLITAARRDGTISHYQSAWNKWSNWCSRKQNDPVRGSINQVIEFLSDAFDEGLEFSTIAGYRSAISAYHDPIDGVVVGKYPLISSLMSGIHNKRFPQPKYTFIWDVEKVVSYLSSIDSENCTDKDLTLKLTMLLALTSAARAHELTYLDIRFLVKHHSFYFNKPTKVAKVGKARPPLKFSHFTEDKNLCVCHNIDLYITRTSLWRTEKNQLLLSFIKPHKEVATSSVSRWIIQVLNLAGIDTNMFKGHSTRSVSS